MATTVDYYVAVDGTKVSLFDPPEKATLAEARAEIELDAEDISEIPPNFLFLVNGTRYPRRREAFRQLSDVVGADACINIVAVDAPSTAVEEAAIAAGRALAPWTKPANWPMSTNATDITISHCDPQWAGHVHNSLFTRGFNTSEKTLGKLMIALVTDTYLANTACLNHLQIAQGAGVAIQPVVCSKDKLRIKEMVDKSPHKLKLGKVDWIDLDEGNNRLWNFGINNIIQNLWAQPVKYNLPGEWDLFLGHSRRCKDATVLAAALEETCGEGEYVPWLDVKMDDKCEAAIKEGVQNSDLFVAIITGPCMNDRPQDDPTNNAYFKCNNCLQELQYALEVGVPIQPVIRTEDVPRKAEFMALAPDEFQFLGELEWIELNRDDTEFWKNGVARILRQLPAREHPKKKIKLILE